MTDEDRKLKRKAYLKAYWQRPEVKQMSRERKRQQTDLDKFKTSVRNATRYAIKMGRIKVEPCAVCGSLDSEIHHEDYTINLNIVWLCREHHAARHNKANNPFGEDVPWDEWKSEFANKEKTRLTKLEQMMGESTIVKEIPLIGPKGSTGWTKKVLSDGRLVFIGPDWKNTPPKWIKSLIPAGKQLNHAGGTAQKWSGWITD